jgi:hypothetical protein
MVDHFHHGGQIALFLELARVDVYQRKQLVGVYQVEITREGKVPGRNRISFDKGMAEFGAVLPLGAIAEMTQQHFSHEGDMSFHETGVLFYIGLILFQLLYLPHYFRKNVRDGLVIAAADPVKKRVPGFGVQFDCGYSGSILPSVVLFFHQEVQLIQTIQDSAVLL